MKDFNRPYTQSNNPSPLTYSPCVDINGSLVPHGQYFTPPHTPCSQCLCQNGQTSRQPDHQGMCIMLTCRKPKCQKFKRIPGKCCDYKCEDDIDFTDKATLAIVISLSIVLVFTLIAITFVLRKIRRKQLPFTFTKKFGQRLSSVSLSSQAQLPTVETNIDEMIQKHSIPNNLRHHHMISNTTTGTCSKVHVMSSSTCCTAKLDNTKIVNMERNVDKIVGGGFNNLQNNSSCSSMCGKMDVDSLSLVDDSSSEHSVRLKQYEPPSVRSPLLSTAYL